MANRVDIVNKVDRVGKLDKVDIVDTVDRRSAKRHSPNSINLINYINPINKLPFNLALLFLLIFFLASCYTPRYVYSPPAHNVPVLIKKNDSKLAFNYSTNAGNSGSGFVNLEKSRGMDLQAAYAVSNHLALQANYYHRREINGGDFDANMQDSSVIRYHRNLTELGIGYYKILDDNQQVAFQVFAGAGAGKFRFTDNGRDQYNNYHSYSHQTDVTKWYIQPAFMVRSKKNFAASLSNRFTVIRFSNVKTNYNAFELDIYKLDSISYKPHIFWEPSIINTFGFKQLPGLQFEFQMGLAMLQSRRFVDYRTFNFSMGLLLDVPKMLNKKSSKKKKQP